MSSERRDIVHKMGRERAHVPAPVPHVPEGTPAGGNGSPRSRSSRQITVPGVAPAPHDDTTLAVGSGAGMTTHPEPEEARSTPADIAEEEQASLWRDQRARAWHDRRWLRAAMALVAVTGLAALVPYPLRITSECAIIPSERAKVRSELAGVLAEVLVDEGSSVKKGDVIARIDDRALKAERLRVLAEIDKIEAELATLRQGHRREELKQQEAVLAARTAELAFA